MPETTRKADAIGAWLRRQREQRLWSRPELARKILNAAKGRGDTSIPGIDSIAHNIYRWEQGMVAPCFNYQLYICEVLGIPLSAFSGVAQDTEEPTDIQEPTANTSLLEAIAESAAALRGLLVEKHGLDPADATWIVAGAAGALAEHEARERAISELWSACRPEGRLCWQAATGQPL